jgi:hypothetical protein
MLDRNALEELTIGQFHVGNSQLTIREACNKIIHVNGSYVDWLTNLHFLSSE